MNRSTVSGGITLFRCRIEYPKISDDRFIKPLAVAMARPLLANVNLVKLFQQRINKPEKPCTHCNRCIVRTGNFPLGCYDPSRFGSIDEMEAQIMTWSASSDERVLQNEAEVPVPPVLQNALRPVAE